MLSAQDETIGGNKSYKWRCLHYPSNIHQYTYIIYTSLHEQIYGIPLNELSTDRLYKFIRIHAFFSGVNKSE